MIVIPSPTPSWIVTALRSIIVSRSQTAWRVRSAAPFIVVIDIASSFVGFESTIWGTGSCSRSRSLTIERSGKRRGGSWGRDIDSGITVNVDAINRSLWRSCLRIWAWLDDLTLRWGRWRPRPSWCHPGDDWSYLLEKEKNSPFAGQWVFPFLRIIFGQTSGDWACGVVISSVSNSSVLGWFK